MMWEYCTNCFPAMFQVSLPMDANTCSKYKDRKARCMFQLQFIQAVQVKTCQKDMEEDCDMGLPIMQDWWILNARCIKQGRSALMLATSFEVQNLAHRLQLNRKIPTGLVSFGVNETICTWKQEDSGNPFNIKMLVCYWKEENYSRKLHIAKWQEGTWKKSLIAWHVSAWTIALPFDLNSQQTRTIKYNR